jgi:plasmid stabilization system protein ParE
MEGSVKCRVVVRAKAESDMLAAARWYEEQNPGLGTEFLRAAETCIAAVDRNSHMYAVVYKDIRRALFRRFPYGLFFLLSDETTTVIACFHGRQSLARLKHRK